MLKDIVSDVNRESKLYKIMEFTANDKANISGKNNRDKILFEMQQNLHTLKKIEF